ncbi:YbhB/YbcL family Raf kinase inhibitor-like protein [Kitasatospora sp. NPDC090308]|uniref:YbhB/YbcL family Raf kinase inhibitor-like protein n=1 Tax=Kitasatospora sp. NPDC090308 TaxID=3364082 RepID=UPI00380E9DA6
MKLLALLLTPLGILLRRKRAGAANSVRHTPELATTAAPLEVTSASFTHRAPIPYRHATMDMGPNISPALEWSEPPAGTVQMLLVMEDTDTPTAKPAHHVIVTFAPTPRRIEEGELTADNARFTYLPDRRGRTGYQGPRPLPGHGTHHYGFHLYALDRIAPLTDASTFDALLPHLSGHVLASGHLEGTMRG